jgi:hypothetical protein
MALDPFGLTSPVLPTILSAGNPQVEDVEPDDPDRWMVLSALLPAAAAALTARTRDDFQRALAQQPKALEFIQGLYDRETAQSEREIERRREEAFRVQDRAERAQERQAGTSRFQQQQAGEERRFEATQGLQRELSAKASAERREERAFEAGARNRSDIRSMRFQAEEGAKGRALQRELAGQRDAFDPMSLIDNVLAASQPSSDEALQGITFQDKLPQVLAAVFQTQAALGGQVPTAPAPPPRGRLEGVLITPKLSDLPIEPTPDQPASLLRRFESELVGAQQQGKDGSAALVNLARAMRREGTDDQTIRFRLSDLVRVATRDPKERTEVLTSLERYLSSQRALDTILGPDAPGATATRGIDYNPFSLFNP